MATTQYSVRVVKQFTYRGDPTQTFSNRYYFDGGAPADEAAWQALFTALLAAERALFSSDVKVIEAHGYGPSSDAPVSNVTWSASNAGTLSLTGLTYVPGDCAAVLRMATTKKSTKNHTVFCFSYYHGAHGASAGAADDLGGSQKTAIEAYADAWKNGLTVGGRTYKRTTPDGHATTGRVVDPFIGHRDFPR